MVSIMDHTPMQAATCAVCQDLYSDLRPLPCGHGFCPSCAQRAWRRTASGHFQCSLCQDEGGPVPCDVCSSQEKVAVKTCLRCEVSLCDEHLQPHLERPAFCSHLLVQPLSDLSARRCPKHQEMLRYYCMEERAFTCADCVLEGRHVRHQVKGLRAIEDNVKEILRGFLQRAEERLKESRRLQKEQEALGRMLDDTLLVDSRWVEILGEKLQAKAVCFTELLKEKTQQEREEALLLLHKSRGEVATDLTDAENIHRAVSSLLQEKDPYLLIWVRPLMLPSQSHTPTFGSTRSPGQHTYTYNADLMDMKLDAPLLSPAPITLDKKQMLEAIESKYHQFIAETMKCLVELKHKFLSSPVTLDTNSAHPRLSISDDLRSATRVSDRLPCTPHPDRFDHWSQVLTTQSFSSGAHYWEVETKGSWDIAVAYGSIGRKGRTGTAFGSNRLSWSLMRDHDGKLAAWHNKKKTRLDATMSGSRVSVSLNYRAGTITFCEVGSTLIHLHTFSTTFTQPVHLGFGLYKAALNSRISIVMLADVCNSKNENTFADS
ncbi:tripartite motif-containing protein 7-like [Arapaima gigas]